MGINNFSVFKNTEKKSEKEPDYRMTINVGTKDEPRFENCGAGWIKESAKGTKYISFSLSKPYKDKKGWKLVEEDELDG